MNPDRPPSTRWQQIAGADAGQRYADQVAERLRIAAAQGHSAHGEADFVAARVAAPARVLDAGCGSGRIAIRLHQQGYRVTGVDVDDSMLAIARRHRGPDWRHGDLANLANLGDSDRPYDVVVAAGNVIALLADGALTSTLARLAAQLRSDGVLISGFGLTPEQLPRGCPVTPLRDYDEGCATVGLELVERYRGWHCEPYAPTATYAVSVHRRGRCPGSAPGRR